MGGGRGGHGKGNTASPQKSRFNRAPSPKTLPMDDDLVFTDRFVHFLAPLEYFRQAFIHTNHITATQAQTKKPDQPN